MTDPEAYEAEAARVLGERRTPSWWVEHLHIPSLRGTFVSCSAPVTLEEFAETLRVCNASDAQLAPARAAIARRLEYVARMRRLAEPLVWATWPWQRCRARLEPRRTLAWHGRCELKRHDDDVDHALERGFDTVRWSTEPTS